MRAIGQIEHPNLKITVFKNEGRTSVKFETPLYEQTFKLGDDDRFSSLEGIQALVDRYMIERVLEGFRFMHGIRLEALNRTFPANSSEMFEEII